MHLRFRIELNFPTVPDPGRCEVSLWNLGRHRMGWPHVLGTITVRINCDPQVRVCGGFTNNPFFYVTIRRTFPILHRCSYSVAWLRARRLVDPAPNVYLSRQHFSFVRLGKKYSPNRYFSVTSRVKFRWQIFSFMIMILPKSEFWAPNTFLAEETREYPGGPMRRKFQ